MSQVVENPRGGCVLALDAVCSQQHLTRGSQEIRIPVL